MKSEMQIPRFYSVGQKSSDVWGIKRRCQNWGTQMLRESCWHWHRLRASTHTEKKAIWLGHVEKESSCQCWRDCYMEEKEEISWRVQEKTSFYFRQWHHRNRWTANDEDQCKAATVTKKWSLCELNSSLQHNVYTYIRCYLWAFFPIQQMWDLTWKTCNPHAMTSFLCMNRFVGSGIDIRTHE